MKQYFISNILVLFAYFFIFNWCNPILAKDGAHSLINSHTDTTNDKPSEQVYKNIQVLKGMPATKLHTVMRFIANSLGVGCDFCHVRAEKGPWPMEKDDKKTKETARDMINMMRKINDDNFEGRQVVNCATCHNGSTKPVSYPPFSREKYELRVNKDSLPEASTIINKYIDAVGGKSSFGKFKTRITKGDMVMPNGMKQPAEIQESGTDRYFISKSSEWGPTLIGCSGTKGWIKLTNYEGELDEDDLMDIKKEIELDKEYTITTYTNLKVTGMQKIPVIGGEGERKAYEIHGVDNFGNFVKLFFDSETGLLLRETFFKQNPFGSIAIETNYDDYREIDGVKLPYIINWHSPDSNEILKITEIKNSATVEDSKFEMPK